MAGTYRRHNVWPQQRMPGGQGAGTRSPVPYGHSQERPIQHSGQTSGPSPEHDPTRHTEESLPGHAPGMPFSRGSGLLLLADPVTHRATRLRHQGRLSPADVTGP
jgi:hypothetical protein